MFISEKCKSIKHPQFIGYIHFKIGSLYKINNNNNNMIYIPE